ncbi:MAG: HAD-IB family hydrolase [Hyphomonadaceae bacterium]|nr:HAD-IB family hydrolase [Hyphomonadaceae bacterium]
MTDKQKLVIFDLDYTLTKRGTWGRFMWMCLKPYPHKWMRFLAAVFIAQWRYRRGQMPRVHVKETMIRHAIKGWSQARLECLAENFTAAEVPHKLRPGGFSALKVHQNRGDRILIASAAADILVNPIAKRLGVADFVATDVAWSSDSKLETRFASGNCYGKEKLYRVMAWMESKGLDKENLHITTYSDSHADIPLFEFSDLVVAVAPSRKLKVHTQAQSWQIVDWG